MRGRLFPLVAVGLLAAGCAGTEYAAKDKAGERVLTLRVIVGDRAGTPSDEIAQTFAQRVEDASGGAIRVDVSATHQPLPTADYPARTIRAARSGAADVVVVPSRGWAGNGVTTLLPLELPMLVTSDRALDAVSRDAVSRAMLEGITPAGFEPLALVPDGLQFVVGFARPLATPSAFTGAAVRAPSSAPVYAALSALGARPSYTPGFRAQVLARQGHIAGTIVETARMSSPLIAGTVTANMPFGASTVTLALTHRTWKRLDADQRRLLAGAARAVGVRRARERVGVSAASAETCRYGLGVALAGPRLLATLQMVSDRIARSEGSTDRAVVARLKTIASRYTPAPVKPCRIHT
jgi:TRAP-type transport system periplasmic protein